MSLPQRAAVCPLLLVLYLAVVAAGCRDQEKVSGQATVEQATEHGPAAADQRSAEGKLPEMVFRAVPENDPLLGQRFHHQAAGYSIRPPAAWIKSENELPQGEPAGQLLHRTVFRDPQLGDFLEVGLMNGGPDELDAGSLISLKNSLAAGLTRNQDVTLIGTDAYRYKKFSVIQVMIRREGRVVFHLMVFKKPGEFSQIVFAVAQERYHELARAVEATIASFNWKSPA